jgi:hypothetical protein
VNGIQNFVMQLWNDLRARRLVPVAVLLVAGLIAAPVVLSKKAEEPPAPAPAPAPTQAKQQIGPEELAKVKLEDALGKGNGSSLSAFDVNNPFAPPAKVLKAAREETLQVTGTGDTTTGGGTTDTGTGTDTGGGTGGGTDNGTGGGGGGGGGGTTTTEFTYVLDVTFWANGHKRSIKGMEKLDILPSEANPLLIFMGVTDGAGNAVFLVDSTLDTAGEGKCTPSKAECAFLYLGAGSEQEFTNEDGDSYRLLINEIRKVKVGDENAAAASKKKTGKTARAAVGDTTPARRFSLPILTDLVVESGDGTNNSTGADERR